MSADDDTWHQPTWMSSEWTPPSTLRAEHDDAPSETVLHTGSLPTGSRDAGPSPDPASRPPRTLESSSLAKADPPPASPDVPPSSHSALAAACAPTFDGPSGPEFREAVGAQTWPTYGDPLPVPAQPATAPPAGREPVPEPMPVERIPTDPPPALPDQAGPLPWPTRDWSRHAGGSRDNGVTPGLSAQSREARARGAWPGSPTTPDGIATPQSRPAARPVSRTPTPRRSEPRNATAGAVVLSALGAGALALSLADTTHYTPVFSILAALVCASLLPGTARRGNAPSRGWQRVGAGLLVVNVMLVALGFFLN